MSTLILQAAGSVIGGMVGGPIGAAVGQALGGLAGSAIDSRLFAAPHALRQVEGPRLKTLSGLSSTEGAPIPRVYGRVRLGGEIIWSTRFLEQVSYQRQGGGGSGKGGASQPTTISATYDYFANIAVGLCEGPIAFVQRVWADGQELDLTTVTMRVHRGTQDQDPDPLVVAKEGADRAPAYRGTAYVVFEGLALARYGNRLPQLSFEVVRPVSTLAAQLRAVHVIPGAGEFVYAPDAKVSALRGNASSPVNRHQLQAPSDWEASLDVLQALCPRLERVGLVVSWFGTDLRGGECRIVPKAESAQPLLAQGDWSVAGLTRATAAIVSQVDGRAAFGGTPSDASVIAAIRDLRARGLAVTLYPFLQMDVAAGNTLPDPWSGAATQPAYPWRGRITVSPAPGVTGSPDGTPAAAEAIRTFFGSAKPADFKVRDGAVLYAGPAEWSFRRHVLHHAALAIAAGGVDTLVIGSELVGLTRVRSAPGIYPAVAALAALASDLRAMLGPGTRLTYAADWTEYGSHVPAPGELRFPLDPLWASTAIDAVSIDAWWPLADWRDGTGHADAARARSVHEPAYLLAGTTGGEGADFYYADVAGRAAQDRRPITDGAYGKPFVYRPKDLSGWWSQPHVERVGGVEVLAATAWVPRSKPIWLNEIGCPAVDRGANGPNAFPDPKSSQGGLPPFSRGTRDDLMLHRSVCAMLRRFDPSFPGNSTETPAGMVDPGRTHVWAWDARPFPAFPSDARTWADAAAWATGHWLTGRLEAAPADDLLAAIIDDFGLPAPLSADVDAYAEGYVVDRPMSARAALEPLAGLFGFDAAATAGGLRFVERRSGKPVALDEDDLVPDRDGSLVRRTRTQEAEIPHEISLAFSDPDQDYARATVTSRRLAGASRGSRHVEVAAVIRREEAGRLADIALHDAWLGREHVEFTARPGCLGLEVGDLVLLPAQTGAAPWRIERIRDAQARTVTARAVEPRLFDAAARLPDTSTRPSARLPGRPLVQVIDWPIARGDPAVLQSLAVSADPWPGRMAVWRSVDGASFELFAAVEAPSTMGTLLDVLPPGPAWRFDDHAAILVEAFGGAFTASGDLDALGGQHLVAVLGQDGACEVIAYARAELVGPGRWRLTRLVRGLGGSEPAALRSAAAGSRIVALDRSLVTLAAGASDIGRRWIYRVVPAGRDVADPAMVEFAADAGAQALRPLAPVGAKARRGPDGVAITCIRRGRIDSDAWEPLDIPLGEESATFRCDIATPRGRRSLVSRSPSFLYAAADESADFGTAAASALALSIVQVSAAVGDGEPFAGTVPIA
jgi:hypothetical protein